MFNRWLCRSAYVVCSLLFTHVMSADEIRVKYPQGSLHAFLVIRSEDGKIIGTGDALNEPMGGLWRNKMTLKLRDGSLDEETTLYSQRG